VVELNPQAGDTWMNQVRRVRQINATIRVHILNIMWSLQSFGYSNLKPVDIKIPDNKTCG
jgi:hypothetical protein